VPDVLKELIASFVESNQEEKPMKRLIIVALALCLVGAVAFAQSADTKYGEPMTVEGVTPLADILESPEMYVGKEVRTAGYIYTMCDDSGCWLGVLPSVGGEKVVKVAYSHTDVRFPIGEETTGRYVELQGEVVTVEQEAEEHAAHMAAEGGAHEHAEEAEHAEHAVEMRTVYVCPMHADVVSEETGICPVCKMDLEVSEVPVPAPASIAIMGASAVVKAKK
jgi:hypothetical protein